MILSNLLFHLLNGLFWGSLVALIAVGLSLVYGQLGVINLAHGEFYMLGAVFTYYILSLTNSFFLAIIIAPSIVALIGFLTGKFLLQRTANSPTSALIITYGLSIVMQYIVLFFFGGAPRRIPDPIDKTFYILGNYYAYYRIVIIIISSSLFLSYYFFIQNTKYGIWIRAVGYNPHLAKALGIPMRKIYFVTFCLSSGLAAFSGVLASPIVAVEFKMGGDIIILAFMASVIGGLGNLLGTFVISLILGICEGELLVFIEAAYAKVLLLILACVFMSVKPEGLFQQPKSAKRL